MLSSRTTTTRWVSGNAPSPNTRTSAYLHTQITRTPVRPTHEPVPPCPPHIHRACHRLCASAPYLVYRNTNPRQVYVGKAPWLWPVNGFLAGPSQNQSSTMYIGLYQQGYKTGHEVCNYTSSGTRRVGAAGAGGSADDCGAAMIQLRSDDNGSWLPWPADEPLVCNGDPDSFDHGTFGTCIRAGLPRRLFRGYFAAISRCA